MNVGSGAYTQYVTASLITAMYWEDIGTADHWGVLQSNACDSVYRAKPLHLPQQHNGPAQPHSALAVTKPGATITAQQGLGASAYDA